MQETTTTWGERTGMQARREVLQCYAMKERRVYVAKGAGDQLLREEKISRPSRRVRLGELTVAEPWRRCGRG